MGISPRDAMQGASIDGGPLSTLEGRVVQVAMFQSISTRNPTKSSNLNMNAARENPGLSQDRDIPGCPWDSKNIQDFCLKSLILRVFHIIFTRSNHYIHVR